MDEPPELVFIKPIIIASHTLVREDPGATGDTARHLLRRVGELAMTPSAVDFAEPTSWMMATRSPP